MAWRIEFAPDALKDLRDLPVKVRRQIARKIDALAANPRPVQSKKLEGSESLYRIRSGDYRIVYQIKDAVLMVLVICVARRKDVYRHLPGG